MQTDAAAEYNPTPAEIEALELETALYYLATRVVVTSMAINPPQGWTPELDRAASILKRRGVIDLRKLADNLFDNVGGCSE